MSNEERNTLIGHLDSLLSKTLSPALKKLVEEKLMKLLKEI